MRIYVFRLTITIFIISLCYVMNSDTKMIRCTNACMYAKMNRLKDIITNTSEIIRTCTQIRPDAAVLTEMTMMGSLSLKCNHCPSRHTDVMSFERPIPNKTPSYVEDMSMCMTANSRPIKNASVRHNPVTAAIISDSISILEFMDRFENRPEDMGTIVLATYPSVTHAATIAYVFECISSYAGWNGVVGMNIITDEITKTAMEAYVGPKLNVNLMHAADQIMCANELMNMDGCGYMTVITHNDTFSRMLLEMGTKESLDVNMVMSINTIEIEQWVRSKCAKSNMLMEMCPCSDPKKNMVRIVPISRYGDASEMTIRTKHVNTPIFAHMRWYTVMIRRMKVDDICYDCAIALKLAYSILYLVSGREMDMSEMQDKRWVENFRTTASAEDLLE